MASCTTCSLEIQLEDTFCARCGAPVVDPLEGRLLLTAVLSTDGTLQVTGSDGPDQITVRRGGEPNKLNVQDGNATLFVFPLDRVKTLDIRLGNGDDTVNVDTTPGLIATGDLTIHVDGGAGNDSLLIFGSPAAGAVHEALTVGPEAGGGTLVASTGAGTHAAQRCHEMSTSCGGSEVRIILDVPQQCEHRNPGASRRLS